MTESISERRDSQSASILSIVAKTAILLDWSTFSMTGYLTSEYSVNVSVNYQLAGYEIVPSQIQTKIVEKARQEKEEETE